MGKVQAAKLYVLRSFLVDSTGAPASDQVGSDPSSAPRSYCVYNAHGDVVDLTDTNANLVASYSYDSWGNLTSSNETFTNGANGWSNPYRYDGRDGARYDASTGLYWLSVRAYDPSVGRFLSRDPLGRAPLFFADNP
ncbi:MAG TPA: RHS repeat-associated core domain-containing protein [Ktedonobacterales bacterium]